MYTLHGTSEQPVEKCFLLGESGGSISQLTSQNKELLQQTHSLFNNIKSRELWFPGHVKHGNGVDACKHKHKSKDQTFSFSLFWCLCSRSLTLCENKHRIRTRKLTATGRVWPIKALVSGSPLMSILTKWRMPWLILMLMSTFVFT